mgnify:CR=1 FL=1
MRYTAVMAHEHEALLTKFYAAFSRRDGESMGACYAGDASFSDPVFVSLDAKEVRGMWRMLCEQGKDLKVEASNMTADAIAGSAHWEAYYTFSATGKSVHNIIDAKFKFRDGLIVEHIDSFDFWRWSRMALGVPGVLLGWTPLIRNKVRSTARGRLEAYLKKHPG